MSTVEYNFDRRATPQPRKMPVGFTVSMRERWDDDWTETGLARVDDLTWQMSPRYGVANLSQRFGPNVADDPVSPLDRAGYWVKISARLDNLEDHEDPISRDWWGVVVGQSDEIYGGKADRSGIRHWTAYEMPWLLDRHVIRGFWWEDAQSQTQLAKGALDFNAGGRPNHKQTAGGAHVFAREITNSYWSTETIVRYLLSNFTVPWVQSNDGYQWRFAQYDWRLFGNLPTNDQPTVQTYGRSVGQLLRSLINRKRLMGWWIEVGDDNWMELHTASFNITDLPFFPANPNVRRLDVSQSAGAAAVTFLDRSTRYDQIYVEGGRRRSVFSVANPDATLNKMWDSEVESAYDQGASTSPSYPPAAEVDQRRKANTLARAAQEVRDAYSRFGMQLNWDGRVGDGLGGSKNPAFIKDPETGQPDDLTEGIILHPSEYTFDVSTPLIQGFDYWTEPNVSPFTPLRDARRELPPFVVMQLPEDASKWVDVSLIAFASYLPKTDERNNYKWSGSVRVNSREYDPSFNIRVSGQPQHVLADHDMPLPEDEQIPRWDWSKMIATVSMRETRRCFAAWPPFDDVTAADPQHVETMRIYAGDDYKLDFAAAGTVMGVNPVTGALRRNYAPRFIRDDRLALQAIAIMAYEWFKDARVAFQLTVRAPIGNLKIGDLVEYFVTSDLDRTTTESVVTSIRISNPENGLPSQTIRGQFAELDPLAMPSTMVNRANLRFA